MMQIKLERYTFYSSLYHTIFTGCTELLMLNTDFLVVMKGAAGLSSVCTVSSSAAWLFQMNKWLSTFASPESVRELQRGD